MHQQHSFIVLASCASACRNKNHIFGEVKSSWIMRSKIQTIEIHFYRHQNLLLFKKKCYVTLKLKKC